VELWGHEVRTAYSGRNALKVAENFRPQVVILDIGLPDLDGYQVAQCFREARWGKDAMLVAVTGWGREDDRRRAFAVGFDQHLVKPITGEALQGLLRSLPNGHPTEGYYRFDAV
jgi:DNA-binding response OmpR family regulator